MFTFIECVPSLGLQILPLLDRKMLESRPEDALVKLVKNVQTEDLKKYELPKSIVVLLTANMDTRDASAFKNDRRYLHRQSVFIAQVNIIATFHSNEVTTGS